MEKKCYYIRNNTIVFLDKILKAARQQLREKLAIVNNGLI